MNLVNVLTGLGTSRDKLAHTEVIEGKLLTFKELKLLYNNWIAAKFVDAPSEDCLRNGRTHSEKLTEEQKAKLSILNVDNIFIKALKRRRLFGGSMIFMGSSNCNYISEAEANKSVDFLKVYSQYEWQPDEKSIEVNPTSPDYGKPLIYKFLHKVNNKEIRIHRSHFIIFEGEEHFDDSDLDSNITDHGGYFHLGYSPVQKAFDAIANAVSATNSVATMIVDAKLDIIKIEGLLELLAEENCEDKIAKRLIHLHNHKSVHRSYAIDSSEEMTRVTTNLQHLPEVIREYFTHLSGASNIPITRFLGVQTKGLGNGNEGDIQNYNQMLESIQNVDLLPAYKKIDSAIGINSDFKFNPVGNDSDSTLLELDKKVSGIVTDLYKKIDDESLLEFIKCYSRLDPKSILESVSTNPQNIA